MKNRSSWRALCAASLVVGTAGLAACGDNLKPEEEVEEPTPGTIALVAGSVTVDEGGTYTATARRTGGEGAVGVEFATSDDSAEAGTDYTEATGSLSWIDGETGDKTFTVASLTDLVIEGDETLEITLANPTGGATLGGPRMLTVTITDDDRVGDTVALTSTDRLVTFDRTTPGTLTSGATVSGLTGADRLVGLDRRPADGVLYALSTGGRLYTVDPGTGVATLASTLAADPADATAPYTALAGTQFGIDFNPLVDRLRVVSDSGQNLRINVDTGAVTTDTGINGAATGYGSAAYTNAFRTACRTALYAIDVATDRLLVQNPPNDGVATAVGTGLGVDATALVGFDITTDASATNTALAALTVSGITTLYSIDVSAGTATAVGPLGLPSGETATGLALPVLPAATPVAQPPGELYGLTAAGDLLSFMRTSPGRACSQVTITGLAAGDVPAGIDFRPSTGALHLLTNAAGTGKVYTVAPATGAATAPVTLTVALTGTDFGMDFNPTGPVALRIVSNSGQNLRVTDLATGATTADTNLTAGGVQSGASAAAYTDAVPGAGATTLYVIDAGSDRLRLQNPPNAGNLTDIGPLGIDIGAVNGFDIDGRDNLAFLGADLPGSTASSLHTVNLTSGAASAALGTFATGIRLRGLTRTPPATTVFGLAAGNTLVRLSLADPSMVTAVGAVTGLGAEQLVGLDVRPSTGILYGVSDLGGVFAIDPATATATRVSNLGADPGDLTAPYGGLAGTELGMDFNPTGAVALRLVSDSEQNLRVPNIATGATITDTSLVRTPRTYTVAAVAYSNNTAGATATALYGIDSTGDRLVAIAPPNNGTVREIGPLGINADADAAFDIVAADTALMAMSGIGSDDLYSINLTTGAATLIGDLNLSGTVIGIAAPVSATTPSPDSAVFAVTSLNSLVSFARNAPAGRSVIGNLNVPLTETIVGVDVRPSTGELWILTRGLLSVARLYTVNTTTAAMTLRSTLAADASDTTAPYAGLGGLNIGMDFNPTGPVALRIVTDGGANLRVADPMTGATFTDAALTTPGPDVVGAAYTNSYLAPAGVTLTTSLYVLDAATASLMIQGPPNDGILTPVGALSPSLTFAGTGGVAGVSGFDIGGGGNGLALAALQRTNAGVAETFSRLYRINLATGAATEIGTGVGGTPLRGLAISIR